MIDLKRSKAKKTSVIAYRIVFSEYGNDHCKHFKCGFTPDSNPKMGKTWVTKLLFIYVKEPRLKSLT